MSKKHSKYDPDKFELLPKADAVEASQTLFFFGIEAVKAENSANAFRAFRSALNVNPRLHQALYNISLLFAMANDKEGALRSIRETLRMDPKNVTYGVTCAEIMRKCRLPKESLAVLQRFCSDKVPRTNHQKVLLNSALAVAHYDLGNIDEALRLNEETLALAPTDVSLNLNRALINMLRGDWPRWWETYEKTLSYGKNPRMNRLSFANSWHGERLDGKRLLIISDQGAGDAVQFARYFDMVKERTGAKLIYLCQPNVKSLAEHVPAIDEVIGFGEAMKLEHDAYSSLLGVMRVLQISPENARRPRHIDVDPTLARFWRAVVDRDNPYGKKKVALVWSGDPKHGNDHARSIDFRELLPFIKGPRLSAPVRWYSLQVGDQAKETPLKLMKEGALSPTDVVDLGTDLRDYSDTAAALCAMDAFVTVDTSAAHVAGCVIGAPKTFVLLSHPMEWRWLLSGRRSPWYDDDLVLLRQTESQNWTSVFDELEKELNEILR